jgi:GH15 family glucan-1,4-alpha-glucosidase
MPPPQLVHIQLRRLTRKSWAGREGAQHLEKMLTYANHLGLYSEEIALTGEQIGNFPLAFTHLALIDAALTLNRQLDRVSRVRKQVVTLI